MSLSLSSCLYSASRRGVFELVAPRVAMLRPGDLIVVRTPGTFYKIFRSAAKHKVDHLVRQTHANSQRTGVGITRLSDARPPAGPVQAERWQQRRVAQR